MVRKTRVQSQVESYQRLRKWYLMPPCLRNIVAEGFRFMPLGLVKLRTFRLRCNINAGVHACTQSERVTQRCHNSPDGKRGYRVRVTSRTASTQRILGILKKVSWVEFCLGRRRLTFACSQGPWQVSHAWEADEKARIERMCISLLMSKNL